MSALKVELHEEATVESRAARLRTFGTRERNTLPPEMSLCGAKPNQEQKFLLVGKRDMSVPISERTVWAMDSEIPVMSTMSMPRMRNK